MSSSKVEIQINLDFAEKTVYKVSDSILVVFTKCENTGIDPFFRKQMMEKLSAIRSIKDILFIFSPLHSFDVTLLYRGDTDPSNAKKHCRL